MTTPLRPLTPAEARYVELDREWRLQTHLIETLVPCFHLALRGRFMDGCPYCKSLQIQNECERDLNALHGLGVAA